ncbi:MAG: tetratricopeptide repeat protein [Anaerolineae bacterium]
MLGTIIANRYLLREKLGEGGMGVVYGALDRLTGQKVALKLVTVRQEELEFTTLVSGSSIDLRMALAQEFKLLASLRHPHVISVIDYGFEDNQPYFTMELLESPQDLVTYAVEQPPDVKLELLAQTLLALSYLHRRGILHRDLKPGNVLVTQDGTLKVLDFGLAIEAQAAREGSLAGTLAYVAPEVLIGQPASSASDLYAVGVMAYEMFSGHYPFAYNSVEDLINQLLTALPDLDSLAVDEPVLQVIGRLLSKKPEDRYPSVSATLAALGLPQESAAARESFLQAARFVGREQEMNTLSAALDKAIEGWGSVWLIGGESGVGKSRLLDELRIMAMVRGALVLRGQGISEGGLSYQLWRDMARRLLLYAQVSDEDVRVLKEIVPDIGQLLGKEVADAPELDGPAAQQRLISHLVNILLRLPQPALILLEDLHWVRESLDVLKTLLPLLPVHHLMVVASYRDDDMPVLPQTLAGAQVLRLARLTRENTAELAESMLGEAGRRDDLVSFLQQQTEGNSFFLVEVVRVLAEDAGGLEQIGQRTLPMQVFAGGIERVVRRRLERVSARAYALLQIAAVAGREIELHVLEAVVKKGAVGTLYPATLPTNLSAWLSECSDAAVLEVDDTGDWRFVHDKLREQLLADLSPEMAKQLHRLVAEALEAIYAEAPEYTLRLVRHWGLAEDYVKEAHYSMRAGEQCLALSFASDALTYFRRAAQHVSGDEQQARILVSVGQAYLLLGDYGQALEALGSGLELARKIDDRRRIADSLSWLGQISVNKGDYPPGEAYYNESLTVARAIGYRLRTAEVLTRLGRIAVYYAHYEQSTAYIEEAITLATALGDLATQAQAYNNLAITANLMGNYERALQLHQQSLERARALGDRFAIARALNNMGEVHKNQSEFPQARDLYLEALPLLREINHKWGVAAVHDNLGYIAVLLGNYGEARQHFREALHIGEEIGASTTTLDVMVGIARLLAVEGQAERAAEIVGTVLAQSGINAEIERKVNATKEAAMQQLNEAGWEAAVERGKTQELAAAVRAFLAEHKPT